MGWRGHGRGGSGRGLWPGHGPFSNLPPWQRPGWLYGRGACWWLYPYYTSPQLTTPDQTHAPSIAPLTPFIPRFTKEQETQLLEQQMATLQAQLDAIKNRLTELTQE
jgi:hypothetical protein